MLQLSGNRRRKHGTPEEGLATLVDLRRGDAAILHRIDLPGDDARRLMGTSGVQVMCLECPGRQVPAPARQAPQSGMAGLMRLLLAE